MKCPKCNYVSHDYLDECRKCHVDLLAFKQQMGLLVLQSAGLDLSLVLMDESDDLFGDRMFTEADVALPAGEDDFDISLDEYSSNPLLKQQLSALRPQGNRPTSDHLTLELDTSLAKELMAEAPQGSAEPSNRIPAEPAPPATIAGIDVPRQPSSPGHLTLELDPQDFIRHATAKGPVPPTAEITPIIESDETSYTIPTIELTDPNLQAEELPSAVLEEPQTEFGRGIPELQKSEMLPELTAEALHPAGLSSSLEPVKAKGKGNRLTEELLQDDTLEEASLVLEPPPGQAPSAPELEPVKAKGKGNRLTEELLQDDTLEEASLVLEPPPGQAPSAPELEPVKAKGKGNRLTEELLQDDTLEEASLVLEPPPGQAPSAPELEPVKAKGKGNRLTEELLQDDTLEEASLVLEPPPGQAPPALQEINATIKESEVVLEAQTVAPRFPVSSPTPSENATEEEGASTLTEELLADDTLQEAELRQERLTPDRTPPAVVEAYIASDEMAEPQMDQMLYDALEADPFEETDTDFEFRMEETASLLSGERVLPPPEPLSAVEGSVSGVDADDGLTAQEAGSVTFDEIEVGFDIPSSAEVTPLSFESLASHSEASRPPGSSRPREADPGSIAEDEPDFSAFDLLNSEERERMEELGETTLDTPDYVSLDTPADLILDTPEHVTLELDAAELRAEQWIDTLSETQPEIVPEDPGTLSTFEVDLPPESKEHDPLWPSLSSHDDELLLDLDDLDDEDETKR